MQETSLEEASGRDRKAGAGSGSILEMRWQGWETISQDRETQVREEGKARHFGTQPGG